MNNINNTSDIFPMDFREPPAHHQQLPPYSYQQPLMQSQLHFYTPPQILSNNNNINNDIYNISDDMMLQQNPSTFNVPENPSLEFTDASSSLPSSGFNHTYFSTESSKKKRGRPRKYDNIMSSLPLHDSEHTSKKRDALGSAGVGFTPHVITVDEGEDIASKILDFLQRGPCTVCILSANGTVWNVTLRQTAMPSCTKSYEGNFEIITLSGSFSLSDNNGILTRIGSLSVSFAGPDGKVLGGVVAGELIAATPVQVIVGSFITDGRKLKSVLSPTPPPSMLSFGASAAEASPMKERSSVSLDASVSSQLSNTTRPYCSTSKRMVLPLLSNVTWVNSTMNMLPY